MIYSKSSVLYQNRHCYQNYVDILFKFTSDIKNNNGCSFLKVKKDLFLKLDKDQFVPFNDLSIKAGLSDYLSSKGLVSENSSRFYKFYSKLRPSTICILMKELYIFCEYYCEYLPTTYCYKYNFKLNEWYGIASMRINKQKFACAVFEGKIVVTGGWNGIKLKSVEAYDHHENKWTLLPDMIEKRCYHSTVSMGNKLFVTAGPLDITWEVFDSITRKFTLIRYQTGIKGIYFYESSACCVADKIILSIVTSENTLQSIVYDTRNETFSM